MARSTFQRRPVPAQLATVVIAAQDAIAAVRNNQLDAPLFQPSPHGIAVVTAIGTPPARASSVVGPVRLAAL